jgi:hypothetical protein
MLRRRCGLIAAKPRFAVERAAVGRAVVARAAVGRALPRTLERAEVVAPAAKLLRATVVRLRRAVGVDLRLLAEEFKVRLAIFIIPPAADLQQLPYQTAECRR